MIHTVKGFSILNKAEEDVLLEFSCFSYDPVDVGNFILVPLLFLNPAWTYGSSQFTYCWSLIKEFWALLGQHVRWVQLCGSLNILWHCLSLRLEWKWTFPVLWSLLSFPNLLESNCGLPNSRQIVYLQCEWVKLLSRVQLFPIPWTVAYQASLSMGFSRQEYPLEWVAISFSYLQCK